MNWNINEIKNATKINNASNVEEFKVGKFVIDSRLVEKDSLFFALDGKQSNGHDFVCRAIENGASYAVVSEVREGFTKFLSKLIMVDNVQKSLEQMANFHAKKMHENGCKIIGITGSVGKSTCKEMLANSLEKFGLCSSSQGNYNTEIGMSLSICNSNVDSDFGVFELGMRGVGQIKQLTEILKINIAIITEIAAVHIEFFNEVEDIAKAKSEIFAGLIGEKIAIIPESYEKITKECARKYSKEIIKISSNLNVISQELNLKNQNKVRLKIHEETIDCKINFLGSHHAQNAAIVITAMTKLGINAQDAAKALENIHPMEGRGKITKSHLSGKNIVLIDESYNASPKSMIASLKILKEITSASRKIAILGDMVELGEKSNDYHQQVLNYAKNEANVEIISVGKKMFSALQDLKCNQIINYATINDLIDKIDSFIYDGDVVMIKGSNAMNMNKIVKYLTEENAI